MGNLSQIWKARDIVIKTKNRSMIWAYPGWELRATSGSSILSCFEKKKSRKTSEGSGDAVQSFEEIERHRGSS